MIRIIEVKEGILLEDYELYASLSNPLKELKLKTSLLIPKIKGRKIWMVNSTSQGGGVAEMMPHLISLFRQVGLEADWIVADSDNKAFFDLTKRVHNLIHGEGDISFTEAEKILYDQVSKKNAEGLFPLLKPGDIVVIHDPQPMGIAKYLKDKIKINFIWRSHIGIEEILPQTQSAWNFLKSYAEEFEMSVFSSEKYIPDYLQNKAIIMYPSINPLDHKNRELSFTKLVGILCDSKLLTEYHPVLAAPFTDSVKRLQPDGSFQSPLLPTDPGILFSPTIVQISRWDRFKGFIQLAKGFQKLKSNINLYAGDSARHRRRLELLNLVLAGPDPSFVSDDPEGKEILKELSDYFLSLPKDIQSHIILLKLPMTSRKENGLVVNALQRLASIVVQNSIKEGFGLTITEAMWKNKPVLGTYAWGIQQQIRDNINGKLIKNPEDPDEIAGILSYMLQNEKQKEVWGHNAQKTVIENYLIFVQISQWLEIFEKLPSKD
jgi:trehalose synthase